MGLTRDRATHDEGGVLDQPRGRRRAVVLGAGEQAGDYLAMVRSRRAD
jgi:hypothetical protein